MDEFTIFAPSPMSPEAAAYLDRMGWEFCACHYDCEQDSKSGRWHQHPDEPCPVHPDVEMVG